MNRRSFLAHLSSALAVLPWVPKMAKAKPYALKSSAGSGAVNNDVFAEGVAEIQTLGPRRPIHVELPAHVCGVGIPFVDPRGGFGRLDVMLEPGETQTHVIHGQTHIIHRADWF